MVSARNDRETVMSCSGRDTISIGSPARTAPGSITRKYAPGLAASVNRLARAGCLAGTHARRSRC
jgi:hypothetical protein